MALGLDGLSPDQRTVVTAPLRHLLVIAGPGSGKTHLIIHRISHLLEAGACSAEQVLVLTFTIKAAEALRDRLGGQHQVGVNAATFHHFCARLLNEHGAAIGIRSPVRITDEPAQVALLERAAQQAGYRLGSSPPLSLHAVRDYISRRKRLGLEPGAALDTSSAPAPNEALPILDECYCRLLREQDLLDFDDLIGQSIILLREDAETATIVRRRVRSLFIDEFHDVSADHYALIRELVPPHRSTGGRRGAPDDAPTGGIVMVVADPNQAIFGWRGAEPDEILPRFQRDYQPLRFTLSDNFRSTRTIVRAANHLRGAGPFPHLRSAVQEDGHPIFCMKFADTRSEAEGLARLIRRALNQGSYHTYDDIAVLSPVHKRADDAEEALLRHGIPIRRTRPGRFFDDPDAQEVLRHLDLIATLAEPAFEPALNWPHVVVDELTMIHLRRLANAAGMRLTEFVQSPLFDGDEITPLTRMTIRRFFTDVVASLRPLESEPVDRLVMELLTILESRRPPVPRADRATFAGFLEFLGAPLREYACQLRDAIRQGCPIVVCPAPRLDAVAAAAILVYTLREYFHHPARIGHDTVPLPALAVYLGNQPAPARRGICIGTRTSGGMEYGLALQAWRLAQLLLMDDETLDRGRFVVLDLETGSLDVNRTEMIEVAAVRVENGRVCNDMLTSLVRPSHPGSLTHDASELTGIRWSDVRAAPEPHEVVPALLAFLGDDTIAGHNLFEFDLPILSRYARRLRGTVENPMLDTRKLAARLFPELPHDLHSLARQFPTVPQPAHRARADAITTAHLLLHLLKELQRDREVDVLSELLPLVALGMYDQGAPDQDEFAHVFDAAIRAGNSAATRSAIAMLNGAAPPRHLEQALSWLRSRPAPPDPDQERWQRLRCGWQDVLDRFRASAGDHSLASLLIYARLATALDAASESDGRVTLMSLHSAKGREWPLVFLIGLEEGVLPSWQATDDDAIEEARRCFYVGMTRAKRQLVITWSAHALERPRVASRFLSSLPEDVVEHRDYSTGM